MSFDSHADERRRPLSRTMITVLIMLATHLSLRDRRGDVRDAGVAAADVAKKTDELSGRDQRSTRFVRAAKLLILVVANGGPHLRLETVRFWLRNRSWSSPDELMTII